MTPSRPDQGRVWDVLVRRPKSEPADCVFFDDRPVNVESARAAGLRAEHWTGPAPARRQLAELGVRLPA